jgi:glycerol-1-phosphate dehydrogenase [NAD(P)+]
MENILGKEFKCKECGEIHTVDVKGIKYGSLDEIDKFIFKIYGKSKKILVLCDEVTYEVSGRKICENLKYNNASPLILKPENEKRVHAKYEYIEKIERNIKNIDLILTCGTGTITDLGKLAGEKNKIPVISFPTAPSMNGYTSPVAAYIKDGVKITTSVKPCEYVYIDENIITNAPIELIKAGFADSLAKSFANSDWKISSIITGEKFCGLPLKIVSEAEEKYVNKGDLIKGRDKKVIKDIMDGLNLGGISMIIAGSSSPASGGEHLISHFLDMYAHQNKIEPFSFHGLQVGTGIYISSLIYDLVRDFKSDEIGKRIEKRKIDYDEKFEKICSLFPSSKNILKKIFDKKIKVIEEIKEKLPLKWEEIKKEAMPMVYSPSEIEKFLKKAECPLHLSEICDDKKLIKNAILLSRFIRERITILDIADETGILDEFVYDYLK